MELCNTRELGTFKAQMRELRLDGGMTRLVVNDALLLSVTTQLQRHIELLKALLPLLFALCGRDWLCAELPACAGGGAKRL